MATCEARGVYRPSSLYTDQDTNEERLARVEAAIREIEGPQITPDSIDTSHINVTNLSGISANLGSVTSGNITGTNITGGNISVGGGAVNINDAGGISLQFSTLFQNVTSISWGGKVGITGWDGLNGQLIAWSGAPTYGVKIIDGNGASDFWRKSSSFAGRIAVGQKNISISGGFVTSSTTHGLPDGMSGGVASSESGNVIATVTNPGNSSFTLGLSQKDVGGTFSGTVTTYWIAWGP